MSQTTTTTKPHGPRGFAQAGLGPGGKRTLYILGVLSAFKALGLVLVADSLARGIVSVINADAAWRGAILVAIVGAAVRAIAHWSIGAFAAREALGVKEKTRGELADKLVEDGGGSVGSMTALATQGLDELDKYYSTVLPAMMGAAVIPLLVGIRILSADWVSALILVLTIPLIPVFMILVGGHTQEKVSAASAALARLSDNLVELARGLPVLVGLGRVTEQTEALRKISDSYRLRTMETLRTAFLSSLVLELIATISVALVAVFIGVRLINDTLPLEIGLLALILAPECYSPFRDLGSAFHAAQDGVLSLRRAKNVVDAPSPQPLVASAATASRSDVTVENLTVSYPDRRTAAVDNLSFTAQHLGITAIAGASGAGKSTVLAVLAGRLRNGSDGAQVHGTVAGIDAHRLAWVPQHPHTVGDTVRDELRLYAGTAELWEIDGRINELLRQLRLTGTADADPAQLSPGELRRVAVARALLRVDAGATVVLLDEPTAHVDEASSHIIEDAIASLRGKVTVILASHEAGVTNLADARITLDSSTPWAGDAFSPKATPSSPVFAEAPTPTTNTTIEADAAPPASAPVQVSALRLIAAIMRPARGRFVGAVALGVLAALFAASLTAVSGWLIVRASFHPPIMLLLVAIVGVRFFGIGRSVLRYAERLVTHDGIFESVTQLRVRIWMALAELGTRSRKLLRGGTALDYLIVTADSVRDLAPRVLLPPIVGAVTGLAASIAVWVMYPPAVPLLLAGVLVSLIVAPAIALWGDRHASRGQLLIRSEVARRFAALIAAADDLRTNNVDGTAREELRALDRRAGRDARRSAWALGLGGSLVVLACCATSAGMLMVTAPALAAGTLAPELVAVLVLLPLGLLEPLLGAVDAVQQWPALAQDVRRLAPFTPAAAPERAGDSQPETVSELELQEVAARWPDSENDVFSGLSAQVSAGRWLVVSGPSGSGKSTLLTVLLGYLTPTAGQYLLNGRSATTLDPSALRQHIAWAPQEGHLFDSTLRANLLLARSRDDAPTDAEMLDVLDGVGLGLFVATLPLGLDTRVGSEGAQLSGGQRQRVAVARTLLTRAEVVLLDEPTAHLDGEAAHRMMTDLRVALKDQVTVLVTHHAADRAETDIVLDLTASAELTAAR
ncbi:MAG TPA: thiol reductant ABC exporter subunit CydD [Glaciihabitans sp.]|nr:thiol reductant ABC exporter subunit CydD [Glaciihabitans sp.]